MRLSTVTVLIVCSGLQAGSQGAMCVRFSNSGRQLAVACCGEKVFPVRIYEPDTGLIEMELRPPHFSVVYDLQWSDDDRHLVTASADGTSQVWRINGPPREPSPEDMDALPTEGGEEGEARPPPPEAEEEGEKDYGKLPRLVTTLQHKPPCYVYCVALPRVEAPLRGRDAPLAAITGAFDRSVRVWDALRGVDVGLLGGAILHEGYVNSITAEKRTGRLYTGDAIGCIIVWKRSGEALDPRSYSVLHRIQKLDLVNKPITSLMVHPTRRKGQLLVLSHQNTLRLIDLYTYRAVNSGYAGINCASSKIRAIFSPDGKYVVAGSDDGKLRVWDAQSGKPVQCALNGLGFSGTLYDVAWHPSQHLVALAAFGEDMPVLMYWVEKAVEAPLSEDAETKEEKGDHKEEEEERAKERRQKKISELKARWLNKK
jgi:jouberin